jgi:hypothetical protein
LLEGETKLDVSYVLALNLVDLAVANSPVLADEDKL